MFKVSIGGSGLSMANSKRQAEDNKLSFRNRGRKLRCAVGPLNRHQCLNAFGQDRHTWEEAKSCTRNFGPCLGRHRLPDWKAW
jgi:hypothetical protein